MNLIEQTRDLYNKTIAYQKEVNFPSPAGNIWNNNIRDIHKIMNSATAEEALSLIDRTFMYSINFPPENADPGAGIWRQRPDNPAIREMAIDWMLSMTAATGVLPAVQGIQESSYICEVNKVYRNDRLLTINFLRYLAVADKCIQLLDDNSWHDLRMKNINPSSNWKIMELGGGCGHLARTMQLLCPKLQYFIFDLPETLFFSYMFLSLNFPERTALWVSSEEDLAKLDEVDMAFIPVAFADKMHGRTYDLFINTASMGEMPNHIIHYWMDYIQNKVTIKNLYTLNRYLNTVGIGATHRLGENHCSLMYDADWEIVNWELEPKYTKCPYVESLHSRYVEIKAKRPSQMTPAQKVEYGQKLLHEARCEDWFRLEGVMDGTGTVRDNPLSNDLTVTGTLFKMWESIRLNPRRQAYKTMIQYLDRLILPGRMFEEYPYYKEISESPIRD